MRSTGSKFSRPELERRPWMLGRRSWKRLEKRKVIVNLKTGAEALRGILWEADGPFLVLRSAELLETGSTVARPIDGDVVIERTNVDWIQFVDGLQPAQATFGAGGA
jgi:small nuclear ribonucleoprotein (snRNP)-like protein